MKSAMERQKILHSPFDIEVYKDTFINYLEVCIDPEGTIHYAVPSHTKWLIRRYAIERGCVTVEEAWNSLSLDIDIKGLCDLTGCLSVWSNGGRASIVGEPNEKQKAALAELEAAGLLSDRW